MREAPDSICSNLLSSKERKYFSKSKEHGKSMMGVIMNKLAQTLNSQKFNMKFFMSRHYVSVKNICKFLKYRL
jgi:hypothetical protein